MHIEGRTLEMLAWPACRLGVGPFLEYLVLVQRQFRVLFEMHASETQRQRELHSLVPRIDHPRCFPVQNGVQVKRPDRPLVLRKRMLKLLLVSSDYVINSGKKRVCAG